MDQPRPLFRLFLVFSNKQYNFTTKSMWKMSCTSSILKPMTSHTWAVSHNQQTKGSRNPTNITSLISDTLGFGTKSVSQYWSETKNKYQSISSSLEDLTRQECRNMTRVNRQMNYWEEDAEIDEWRRKEEES